MVQESDSSAASSHQAGQTWLVLIYRVPYDRPAPRVYVMRKLKELGAVYLQQAVAVLPDRPELREALRTLSRHVEAYPGEASLLTAKSLSPDWEAQLVARFADTRNAEFAALGRNVARLEGALGRHGSGDPIDTTALTALDAEWRRLEGRRERIMRRDFFGCSGHAAVAGALAHARTTLDALQHRARLTELVERRQALGAALGISNGESADVRGYGGTRPARPRHMRRAAFDRLMAELREIERTFAALVTQDQITTPDHGSRPRESPTGIDALLRAVSAIPEDQALP